MGKKGDLSDFKHGMVVGARRAGPSISETADLLGYIYIYIYKYIFVTFICVFITIKHCSCNNNVIPC